MGHAQLGSHGIVGPVACQPYEQKWQQLSPNDWSCEQHWAASTPVEEQAY